MDIDTDKKRISLSIKDVEEEPEETEYASFLNQQTSEDSVTIRDLIKAGQDDIIKDKIK